MRNLIDPTIAARETTALAELLAGSRERLTVAQITRCLGVTDKDATRAIRELMRAGQVDEVLAATGRPARYGWLRSAPTTCAGCGRCAALADPERQC